jgi:hypothetical protein
MKWFVLMSSRSKQRFLKKARKNFWPGVMGSDDANAQGPA